MKTETFLNEMPRVGKRDHPPRINIVNQVMERIETASCEEVLHLDCLTLTAAVSTSVALVLGILAMQLSPETIDPFVQLVLSMPWGMN